MFIETVYKIASRSIKYAWMENDVNMNAMPSIQEGVDQEMASTHHDVTEQDMDMMTNEIKSPLSLDIPSHKL